MDLESRLAQQDQSILELSDEIYRQQRQIGELEMRLRIVTERLESVAAGAEPPRDAADDVPPHY